MWDIVIIGAWASWLFLGCQIPSMKKVLFLEKNEQVGNKLLLSWNWRCNFTNLRFNKEHYYGDNKDRLDNLLVKTQGLLNLYACDIPREFANSIVNLFSDPHAITMEQEKLFGPQISQLGAKTKETTNKNNVVEEQNKSLINTLENNLQQK